MPPVSDIPADEKLSDALRRLLSEADGRPMRIREMMDILQGRSLQMMIALLSLPFLAPVSIPGLSLLFGLAVAVCGLRIGFGLKPWLPEKILNRQISYRTLEKMIRAGCKFHERLEKIIRPRLSFLLAGPGMVMFAGLAIAAAGLVLSLPIPPFFPLTNTIPGFAIMFFALGLMERDGVLVLLGHILAVVSVVYVVLIALLGKGVLTLLSGWW